MNMYTSLNGIWNVEMLGPDGWEATATAFLEDGKYWAGSENHYTVGNYEVSGNRIEITTAGEQRGQGRTVFGKKEQKLDIKFEGEINGDVIQGTARDNASAYEMSFQITRLADTVRSDLIPLGRNMIEKNIELTDTTRHIMSNLYQRVCDAVQQATTAIGDIDQNKALDVINMKPEINGLVTEALQYQADRVAPTTPDLIAVFRMEDEVIDAFTRIYRLSRRMAKLMLPAVVSSKEA